MKTLRLKVEPNFLEDHLAGVMRSHIEGFFEDPYLVNSAHRRAWEYWHVPNLYTYLRTLADTIINPDAVTILLHRISQLGLGTPSSRPWITMYIPGCYQEIHNDSDNGDYAYVYSLTINDRKTTGGSTRIYKREAFVTDYEKGNAGVAFFDEVPPVFNQLAVFHDQLPHAVTRVDGSFHPLDARFVIHGHLKK